MLLWELLSNLGKFLGVLEYAIAILGRFSVAMK
jgi:hypothetical protein